MEYMSKLYQTKIFISSSFQFFEGMPNITYFPSHNVTVDAGRKLIIWILYFILRRIILIVDLNNEVIIIVIFRTPAFWIKSLMEKSSFINIDYNLISFSVVSNSMLFSSILLLKDDSD